MHDVNSGRETQAERAVLRLLGGGCHLPLGVLARVEGGTMTVRAQVYADAKRHEFETRGNADEAEALAERIVESIRREFPDGLSGPG